MEIERKWLVKGLPNWPHKTHEFPWPELVIEDVTENKEYKMKNYWRKTRLKEEI